MKSNNNNPSLPQRGLLIALVLFFTAACLVSGATSIKSSNSNEKQLKNQYNDESSSLLKHEATKHQSAVAISEKSTNNQKQQQISSATNQSPVAQEASLLSPSGGNSAASGAAQPVAEKKQGDFVAQDMFGADEYVQIKPEEITVNENGKEIVPSGSQVDSQSLSEQQQQQHQMSNGAAANGEHKSVDDELNAHLALDSISQQESAAYHSYSPLVQARPPAPRSAYEAAAAPSHAGPYKVAAPRPHPSAAGHYQATAPLENAQRANRSPHRLPPSYITLKGKLTGINSIISQYPHPAPGYPHQGPRHLPRGAAAGYAAFRDFVRAHASKYKHAAPATTAAAQIGYNSAPQLDPTRYERPKELATDYKPPQAAPQAYGSGGQAKRAPLKTKVTVAQAYIPHLDTQNPAAPAYGQPNAVLAKLYGSHAPQGVGKPEYSKDYGMVIHYPQATVYTEPMTVEQLHKLTGTGISQVLEQLQYNFAHGQRDESNTLRANNKHHIGHGITIHAKEYYAPGKTGHYVPTTAAVISTASQQQQQQQSYTNKPSSAYDDPQAAGYEPHPAPEHPQSASYGKGPAELGSGYERVRQAASSSSQKYNNKQSSYAPSNVYQQQASAYEQPSGNRYGNGEPLSAITSFIGSELDALYKANAALTKQLEPEIYAGIQAHRGSSKANAPLRYGELQQMPYQQQQQGNSYSSSSGPAAYQQHQVGGQYNQYTGQQQMGYKQQRGRSVNHQRRPSSNGNGNRHYRQSQRPLSAYNRQPAQSGYENRPQANSYQQQAVAAYQAAEQSLEQQMMQLLQDFRNGDEQYNTKSQPSHSINQGYPNKVMQKYNQQQQHHHHHQQQSTAYGNNQQNNQQASAYAHHDGLEIPQGPNDQIGEIADLIEALKGSLDLQKPEQPAGDSYANAPAKQSPKQLEDVRYLASALGQPPSYAIQVPVASGESNGAYEQATKKNAGDSGYHQEASSGPYNNKPASAAAGYQGADGGYQNQNGASQSYGGQHQAHHSAAQQQQTASAYQQPASNYQQPEAGYQQPAASSYQQAQPEYQQQQQQQQAPQDYQPSVQAGGDYGAPQHQPQVASYVQSAPAGQGADQAAASGYSVHENSQVINHLVPVTSSSAGQPTQGGYTQPAATGQGHQQPAVSQIAIAAPTESQYQQAQSLSSFVDSLSADYQELLRQPAPGLLEPHAHNGVAAQLALQPANQAADGSGYNSSTTAPAGSAYDTVAAAASQQVASSTASKQSSYQQAQTKNQSTSATNSSGGAQQQQYKKAA